jgi:hypothetical protein
MKPFMAEKIVRKIMTTLDRLAAIVCDFSAITGLIKSFYEKSGY